MKNPSHGACDWIALACAAGALLVSALNLELWSYQPRLLLSPYPGLPIMAPNTSIAIAISALILVLLVFRPEGALPRLALFVVGSFLVLLGGAALAERLGGSRQWINHIYSRLLTLRHGDLDRFLDISSAHGAMMLLCLGVAFLVWKHSYRFAQFCLLVDFLVASAVLLGHFYDIPELYQFPWYAPESGMSVFAAAAMLMLCSGLLFCRPRESVVRLALSHDAAGTVATRFGLGALVAFAGFGLSSLVRYLYLDSSHLAALKAIVSFSLCLGLVLLVWSTVRALERLELDRRTALDDLERNREQLLYSQRLAKVAYWQWNLLTDEISSCDELLHGLGLEPGPRPLSFARFLRSVHPEDRRRLAEAAYGSIAGRSFLSVDFRAVRTDGRVVYMHSQGDVELDERGQPWRLRGASLDVTELKRAEVTARQAEERVRILLDKANEAVRVREDVLSIVSHDLKNPLTSANLGVQLLLRQIGQAADRTALARTAGNVQRSVENMKALVQGILDVGKIQSGTFSIEPSQVRAAELLHATLELMSPIARERSIDLRFADAPASSVVGDRGRLLQVLNNLVGNALKFTPEGGCVSVSCTRDAGRLVFLVEDTGPGIPMEYQRHLFERNWQAPATAAGGHGLGLFIAKGIVEAQQGHIWVESEPGRGSRFRFAIPEAMPGEASEGVLHGNAPDGVEAPHVDLGRGAGVHVPEAVAVASLQLEGQVLREIDVYPHAGNA